MNFANPTRIRLGMAATFFGRNYRVIGRSVLGETEESGTYYWNEFNLETSGGEYADLVFEETGSGGQWRLFEMFDPRTPMTAKEAAEKREGDVVNLDGTPLPVTLVDRSRVYFVEGKVPEGVAVGQHANYFNAEAGDKMIVVSWTGDEVEFYSGRTIGHGAVAAAFNLSGLARLGFAMAGGRSLLHTRSLRPIFFFGIFVAVFLVMFPSLPSTRRAPAVLVLPAAPPPLAVGASGVLEGRRYRIASHALVEVAKVGLRFSRHEYELSDDDNNNSILISGAGANGGNWMMCAPIEPPAPLTPQGAAALAAGQSVKLDGDSARINELFRSTIREVDGASPHAGNPDDVLYGFAGQMKSSWLMVRWNASNITWLQGTALADRTVKAAFAPPAGR